MGANPSMPVYQLDFISQIRLCIYDELVSSYESLPSLVWRVREERCCQEKSLIATFQHSRMSRDIIALTNKGGSLSGALIWAIDVKAGSDPK